MHIETKQDDPTVCCHQEICIRHKEIIDNGKIRPCKQQPEDSWNVAILISGMIDFKTNLLLETRPFYNDENNTPFRKNKTYICT